MLGWTVCSGGNSLHPQTALSVVGKHRLPKSHLLAFCGHSFVDPLIQHPVDQGF